MTMLQRNNFKAYIKQLRLEKGLNQYEMADLLTMKQATISQYENGLRYPGIEGFYHLWKIGVDLNELMKYMDVESD